MVAPSSVLSLKMIRNAPWGRQKQGEPSPTPASRPERMLDMYGFAVQPQYVDVYKAYVPVYHDEETERSDRWDSFLRTRDLPFPPPSPATPAPLAAQGEQESGAEGGRGAEVPPSQGAEEGAAEGRFRAAFREELWPVERVLRDAAGKGAGSAGARGEGGRSQAETGGAAGREGETGEAGGGERGGERGGETAGDKGVSGSVVTEEAWKAELTSLVMGGVPMNLRGEVWQIFVAGRARRQEGMYEALLRDAPQEEEHGPNSSLAEITARIHERDAEVACIVQIEKDLPRTFPGHPALDAKGRDALRRLLIAYSRRNRALGYCQGMNFLAGLLLLLMPEENAFWTLTAIVDELFKGYYSDEMVEAQVDQLVFEDLVRQNFPRLVEHMDALGVQISWITGPWFLSVFVNVLPWESVLRVWDVILYERNRSMLFRTCLALLDMHSTLLLSMQETGDMMSALQSMAASTFDSTQLVLSVCVGYMDINEAMLEDLRTKHRPTIMQRVDERREVLKRCRNNRSAKIHAEALAVLQRLAPHSTALASPRCPSSHTSPLSVPSSFDDSVLPSPSPAGRRGRFRAFGDEGEKRRERREKKEREARTGGRGEGRGVVGAGGLSNVANSVRGGADAGAGSEVANKNGDGDNSGGDLAPGDLSPCSSFSSPSFTPPDSPLASFKLPNHHPPPVSFPPHTLLHPLPPPLPLTRSSSLSRLSPPIAPSFLICPVQPLEPPSYTLASGKSQLSHPNESTEPSAKAGAEAGSAAGSAGACTQLALPASVVEALDVMLGGGGGEGGRESGDVSPSGVRNRLMDPWGSARWQELIGPPRPHAHAPGSVSASASKAAVKRAGGGAERGVEGGRGEAGGGGRAAAITADLAAVSEEREASASAPMSAAVAVGKGSAAAAAAAATAGGEAAERAAGSYQQRIKRSPELLLRSGSFAPSSSSLNKIPALALDSRDERHRTTTSAAAAAAKISSATAAVTAASASNTAATASSKSNSKVSSDVPSDLSPTFSPPSSPSSPSSGFSPPSPGSPSISLEGDGSLLPGEATAKEKGRRREGEKERREKEQKSGREKGREKRGEGEGSRVKEKRRGKEGEDEEDAKGSCAAGGVASDSSHSLQSHSQQAQSLSGHQLSDGRGADGGRKGDGREWRAAGGRGRGIRPHSLNERRSPGLGMGVGWGGDGYPPPHHHVDRGAHTTTIHKARSVAGTGSGTAGGAGGAGGEGRVHWRIGRTSSADVGRVAERPSRAGGRGGGGSGGEREGRGEREGAGALVRLEEAESQGGRHVRVEVVTELQAQVAWLKEQLVFALEARDEAIQRSEALQAAMVEMGQSTTNQALAAKIDEVENELTVARKQIDAHRREITQQHRAMEAQQEASTRALLEQQEESAKALLEAVRAKDAEMEREVGALLGALRAKEERMRGEIETLQDRLEEKDGEIGRLARRLERAAKDMEDIIAANSQQVETQKNVIEMLAESSRDSRQKLAAMEQRALAAESMVEAFVEASSLEEVQSMVDDMPATPSGSLDTSSSAHDDVSMRSSTVSMTNSSLATSEAELERMTAAALAIGSSGNKGSSRQYMASHHPSSSNYLMPTGDSQQLMQQHEPQQGYRPHTAPDNRRPTAVRSIFEGISGAINARMGGAVPGATSLPRTQP
ncbi:hypothetical protein CLOM_g19410 [Closterium sp. NIES-68]|nr:hypothetical protein CLOM_g19410 [Closterium sp. NIES-68]